MTIQKLLVQSILATTLIITSSCGSFWPWVKSDDELSFDRYLQNNKANANNNANNNANTGAGRNGATTTELLGFQSGLDNLPPKVDGEFIPVTDRRWQAVYFSLDSFNIGTSERKKLEVLADYLVKNPTYYLVIEGHCDTRGTEKYNRVLSEKRALACQAYLEALSVADMRIKTVGYGEERPVSMNGDEKSHALNRRSEFVIGIKK